MTFSNNRGVNTSIFSTNSGVKFMVFAEFLPNHITFDNKVYAIILKITEHFKADFSGHTENMYGALSECFIKAGAYIRPIKTECSSFMIPVNEYEIFLKSLKEQLMKYLKKRFPKGVIGFKLK